MKEIKQKCNCGFTLVELAMVLFIVTLLLGAILPPLATQIQQKQIEQTQAQLDEAKEVLFGYMFNQNNVLFTYRLPCPDCRDNTGNCAAMTANDGVEDILGGASCATAEGNLPWTTLGIRENDAWGQRFTYRVTSVFADVTDGANSPGSCTDITLNVSFALCSDGDMTILDGAMGTNIATGIPAIVVSHGKNWADTPSTDETENLNNDANFVYRDFSSDSAKGFDDLIIWISPHILRTKMLNAGILP